MDYTAIFKRKEQKYMLDADQYELMRKLLESKTEPDKFAKNTVCSLYYDTPSNLLIRRSLDMPVYKEKLRVRSYDSLKNTADAFIEIKRKYNGIVYKRRVCLKRKNAIDFLAKPYDQAEVEYTLRMLRACNKSEACLPLSNVYCEGANLENYKKEQIVKEIQYFTQLYEGLRPSMLLTYERTALKSIDEDIRITFDSNILYRGNNLLSTDIYGKALAKDKVLMEIKTCSAMPIWLTRGLSDYGIYKTSFSKYGNAYLETIKSDGCDKVLQRQIA
ncbi:MAG: polyphosphate polymerase domain-containing protein [Clostridia bacterium]|nr:polyphosphate polymerase domain-containing protein [Clostridia bacterium]